MATVAVSLTAGATTGAWEAARAEAFGSTMLPPGASTLKALALELAKAPRRRGFKSVPMILTRPDEWDHEALTMVLSYRGGPKQAFDNTEIEGPWLNLMRNLMNTQVWSWKHPDFLCVSATHSTAHLALYDDFIWEKYWFATLTKGKFEANTLARLPTAAASDPADFEKADGVYSPADNSILVLQRRGAVFIACHNQIWEITAGRIQGGINPDRLSHEAMAAEFGRGSGPTRRLEQRRAGVCAVPRRDRPRRGRDLPAARRSVEGVHRQPAAGLADGRAQERPDGPDAGDRAQVVALGHQRSRGLLCPPAGDASCSTEC